MTVTTLLTLGIMLGVLICYATWRQEQPKGSDSFYNWMRAHFRE